VTATGGVSADRRALLLRAYAAYNNQDVEALLALVSDDVDWPDDAGTLADFAALDHSFDPYNGLGGRPPWVRLWVRDGYGSDPE
jgi:hypothetical protein